MRLGAKLLGTVRYATNDVVLPQGDFRTHLGAAKVSYSFTPRRFVQAFVQYNSRFRLVTSNFRLGFIRDSGTGLFLVYNEQYEALNGNFPALNRALLLKYSHLFNF